MVLDKLSDTNYALRIPERRKKVKVVHCNLMKPFLERSKVVNLTLNMPEELPKEILL